MPLVPEPDPVLTPGSVESPEAPEPEGHVHGMLKEIDAEMDAEREAENAGGAQPIKAPTFRGRRHGQQGAPPPASTEGADLMDEPENDPLDYREWVRTKFRKYRDLLDVKATDEFLDHDRVNTVMADYGPICLEVSREARLYKDAYEDAQEAFDAWWAGILDSKPVNEKCRKEKITTAKGREAVAQSEYAGERKDRLARVNTARRQSELLGTFKNMIHNMKGVIANMGHALAFEWHTSGGITVEDGDSTFRFSPARRTGKKPSPDALMRARRNKES